MKGLGPRAVQEETQVQQINALENSGEKATVEATITSRNSIDTELPEQNELEHERAGLGVR